jgi:hypothetical protein
MARNPLSLATMLGFEPRDVSARGLFYFFGVMAAFLIFTSFAMKWLFKYFAVRFQPAPFVQQPFSEVRQLPPRPRIQSTPELDIRIYLQSQQRLLTSYTWIDAKNRIARIPVDRAMELLVAKGLPTQNPEQKGPPKNGTAPPRVLNPH